MSMSVNANPGMVSWVSLLNQVNETNGAEALSKANNSVTFSADVNGTVTKVTVNIPDDLELPSAVTPEAIDSLMETLAASNLGLSDAQLAAIKDQVTKIYSQMAEALASVQSTSTGAVMFDLYQLMALLVEVAQSQRDSARDLRNMQNQQIQNSIQAQADAQRNAAIVGLVVGVTCGVLSAAVSVGMLVGQGAAYKTQVNTARMSGMEATQNKVTMLQGADTPEHAQLQLNKIEAGIKTEGLATEVKNNIASNTEGAQAKFMAAKNVDAKQTSLTEATSQLDQAKQADVKAGETVETRRAELTKATEAVNKEAKTQTLLGVDVPPVKIEGSKTAAMAKAEYISKCEAAEVEPAAGVLKMYDAATTAEGNLTAAQTAKTETAQVVTQKEQAVNTAKTELETAQNQAKQVGAEGMDLAEARSQYREALEHEAEQYGIEYENAISQKAPRAEIAAARDKMHVARAYVNSELMGNTTPELKSTPTEYKASLEQTKIGADMSARRLDNNMEFRGAQRRIEMLGGINAINTAIGNMLQSMTQSITGAINSEATRMGAEQQKEQEELDQTKDLFNQAQSVVDAAVQLMQAVRQAETQSMRDAIQA